MKTLIFVNQKDSNNSQLTKLCNDLSDRLINYEVLNVDAKTEPIERQLYDIVSTPTIVVARDDGAMVKAWRDDLPLADDVSYMQGNI